MLYIISTWYFYITNESLCFQAMSLLSWHRLEYPSYLSVSTWQANITCEGCLTGAIFQDGLPYNPVCGASSWLTVDIDFYPLLAAPFPELVVQSSIETWVKPELAVSQQAGFLYHFCLSYFPDFLQWRTK